MKKTKLLLPLIGIAPLLGASVGTITSCSCKSKQSEHMVAAETNISIVGNQKYNYFQFTLNSDLSSGQTLTSDLENTDDFSFGDIIVENRLVKIPAVWVSEIEFPGAKTWSKDITFTCKNGDGQTAWTQKISNCSVTYSPNVILTSELWQTSEDLSTDKKTLTGHYTFELGEQLDQSTFELKPYITKISGNGMSYDFAKTKIDVDKTGKTADLTLVINKTEEFSIGDEYDFKLQIECTVIDHPSWSAWQSNVMKGFSLSYTAYENAIANDEDNLVLEVDSTASEKEKNEGAMRLTGLKAGSPALTDKTLNTLVIPAKSSGLWIRSVGNGTNTINLPDNIKKIKIEGYGVQNINSYAFQNNTNIKYVDLTAITNDVQSLESLLSFGAYSFSGWNNTGRIIYNKDLSQYKRHIIKNKLYYAGLTNPSWFGITQVSTEEQLREVAETGGYIQLTKDIEIANTAVPLYDPTTGELDPDYENNYTGQINFTKSCILDLNGHTITSKLPIFNTNKAEFALIGVWDCELVVTDSNAATNGTVGGIKAASIADIHNNGIEAAKKPTYPKDGDTQWWNADQTNKYWEYSLNSQGKYRWRTRESRCFYVRSDIPTRSKGTLEILTGKYEGNCTCIMNYNTTVYIEDGFVPESQKDPEHPELYIGTNAPEFRLLSGYCNDPYNTKNPCHEMLNCWESTTLSGEATFQVWGGKFYNKAKVVGGATTAEYDYFDPDHSTADQTPIYDENYQIIGTREFANWCQNNEPETTADPLIYSRIREPIAGQENYYLAVPAFENYY